MLEDREAFWSRVKKGASGECWEWQSYRNDCGYGVVRTKRNALLRAHRIAYEFAHGPVPEGMFVCHRCDNPPCCNPAHLFAGTPADNNRDMYSKHRESRDHGLKGERNHAAKLSDADVLTIRARYTNGGIFQRELAAEYGVTLHTMNAIIRRRTWHHLPA
jgi:hypothetical protein